MSHSPPILDYQTPSPRKPSSLPKIALILAILANACFLVAIGIIVLLFSLYTYDGMGAIVPFFFMLPLFLISAILALISLIQAISALKHGLRPALAITALVLSLPILCLCGFGVLALFA